MEELYSKHSEKVKYLKPIKINMIDSDLKTSTKSKSIEKNNFLSKKDNICKIYDIKIKNCLKKIDILNKIKRPSSANSSKRKIFFNNKISEFVQKNNYNTIKDGELPGKFMINENIFVNKNNSVKIKESKEEENTKNKLVLKDNSSDNNSKNVNNMISEKSLYLYSLDNALDLQRQIIKKLKNKNYIRNNLISDLHILIDVCPIIKDFEVRETLFTESDFDIFDTKKKEKFLFILNLSNLISVLNLIWEISENVPNNFKKYISNLGMFISFVKRKENTNNIDFVLLTPLSTNLYNFISSYGRAGFTKEKYNDLDVEFSCFLDKYGFDDGYCFEEFNIINLIQNIEENSFNVNPKVMYYIKPTAIKRIISKKIINDPENYSFPEQTNNNKFEGYNEVDFSLTMNKDTKITENENFQIIMGDKKIQESGNIVLNKGSIYFFEIKKSINKIYNNISDTEKKNKRFLEAYKNIDITQNIKFDFNDCTSIYICNKDYNQVKEFIQEKEQEMKNNNIIYSNPQIGISIVIKLRKTMKYLSSKIDEQNEEMIRQKKEIEQKFDNQKNDFEKRLKKLENEKIKREKEIKNMNDKLLILEKERSLERYENLKLSLDVIWPTSIDFIIRNIIGKKFSQERIQIYNKLYEIFSKLSKEFLKIKKDLLYSRIASFIGENIVKEEDIKEWLNIKDILLKRAQENKPYSEYYKAIAKFLYGISYIEYGKDFDCDIMSNSKSRERKAIKEIILFLEIFYEESDLNNIELKYQEIVLYLSKDLLDENMITQIVTKDKESKKVVLSLISCANQDNYKLYNESQ